FLSHSCVASLSRACDHNVGCPTPKVKLASRHTVLEHSRWVRRTQVVIAAAIASGASTPQCGLRYRVSARTGRWNQSIFRRASDGITGCSETAFETIIVTSGSSPVVAAIMKLV